MFRWHSDALQDVLWTEVIRLIDMSRSTAVTVGRSDAWMMVHLQQMRPAGLLMVRFVEMLAEPCRFEVAFVGSRLARSNFVAMIIETRADDRDNAGHQFTPICIMSPALHQ